MVFYCAGNRFSPAQRIISNADKSPAGKTSLSFYRIALQIIQHLRIFRFQAAHGYSLLRFQKM